MNIEKKEKVMFKYAEYLADNFREEMLRCKYVFYLPVLALNFVEEYFAEEDLENNFEEIYEQIFMISMIHFAGLKEE